MPKTLARVFAVALGVLGLPLAVHAAPGWYVSPEIAYVSGYCPPATPIGVTTQVGYFGEAQPRTGDNPNSALLIKVTAGCGAVTVFPQFRLPQHVRRDTSFPIECVRVHADRTKEALKTDPNGGCFQTAQPDPWNRPNVFAWAGLAVGESLEVYMPIEYIRPGAASFSAEVMHSMSVGEPLRPIIQFTVGYTARFKNYAFTNLGRGRGARLGSWDGERVDISFALHNYFQTGTLVIEYGTTTAFGATLGTLTVPSGFEYYPNVTASFTGLLQNTRYYWRPKYTTSYGTFTGQTQTFVTNAYIQRPPGPTCPRYPCVI